MASKRIQSMTTKNDQILVALMSYGSIESVVWILKAKMVDYSMLQSH